MKVALAQINPKVGDIEENLKKAQTALKEAKNASVDLLVFPELTFLGYPARDLLEIPELIDQNIWAEEQLGKASEGITLLVSIAEKNPTPGEKLLFNAATVWQNGKRFYKYKKRIFPYYDVFDEERHFQPGKEKGLFFIGGKKIALTICEDIWGRKGYEWNSHGKDLTQEFTQNKPDLFINLSASPFEIRKTERREKLLQEIATELKCPVLYCNQVGANDELLFDGSSEIINEKGEVEFRLPAFQEKLGIHVLSETKNVTPFPISESDWILKGLEMGIQDYFRKTSNQKAILGLSGGIDSSVVAVLAAHALGPKNVKAVALPSKYNASQSLEDAKSLAKNLEIEFETISIEPLVEAFLAQLPLTGTALENIQPRIRMTLLMALSNKENRILLNTSNKSEIACGYATLYGDSSGALSVIGDLKKHEVYELARFINRTTEIIPKRILERAPTAELRENQLDEDLLPPYETLDKIVELFIEEKKSPSEILKMGIDPKSLETFLRLYSSSEFKRRQLPPALKISPKAFGIGRRIPVVSNLFFYHR